jgi:hypothetical protein
MDNRPTPVYNGTKAVGENEKTERWNHMAREAKIRLVEDILDRSGLNRNSRFRQRDAVRRRRAVATTPDWELRLNQLFQGLLIGRV